MMKTVGAVCTFPLQLTVLFVHLKTYAYNFEHIRDYRCDRDDDDDNIPRCAH